MHTLCKPPFRSIYLQTLYHVFVMSTCLDSTLIPFYPHKNGSIEGALIEPLSLHAPTPRTHNHANRQARAHKLTDRWIPTMW